MLRIRFGFADVLKLNGLDYKSMLSAAACRIMVRPRGDTVIATDIGGGERSHGRLPVAIWSVIAASVGVRMPSELRSLFSAGNSIM